MTKTDRLAYWLKKEPHTYLDMLAYGYSTSPWRRCMEWLERHPKWKLRKSTVSRGGQKLVAWRIVRAR